MDDHSPATRQLPESTLGIARQVVAFLCNWTAATGPLVRMCGSDEGRWELHSWYPERVVKRLDDDTAEHLITAHLRDLLAIDIVAEAFPELDGNAVRELRAIAAAGVSARPDLAARAMRKAQAEDFLAGTLDPSIREKVQVGIVEAANRDLDIDDPTERLNIASVNAHAAACHDLGTALAKQQRTTIYESDPRINRRTVPPEATPPGPATAVPEATVTLARAWLGVQSVEMWVAPFLAQIRSISHPDGRLTLGDMMALLVDDLLEPLTPGLLEAVELARRCSDVVAETVTVGEVPGWWIHRTIQCFDDVLDIPARTVPRGAELETRVRVAQAFEKTAARLFTAPVELRLSAAEVERLETDLPLFNDTCRVAYQHATRQGGGVASVEVHNEALVEAGSWLGWFGATAATLLKGAVDDDGIGLDEWAADVLGDSAPARTVMRRSVSSFDVLAESWPELLDLPGWMTARRFADWIASTGDTGLDHPATKETFEAMSERILAAVIDEDTPRISTRSFDAAVSNVGHFRDWLTLRTGDDLE